MSCLMPMSAAWDSEARSQNPPSGYHWQDLVVWGNTCPKSYDPALESVCIHANETGARLDKMVVLLTLDKYLSGPCESSS